MKDDEYTFNVTIDDTKGTKDINKIPNVEIEAPKRLTKNNVIYWSEDYKRLEGVTEATAIKTKAKKFIEQECIVYSSKENIFYCLPIKDYNKTSHKIKRENNEWVCSCQFHNKIVKENLTHLSCSHVLAVKMQLKIWDYNNENYKQKD